MRINTDVLVEAILSTNNIEHDAPIVHTVAYWLERSATAKHLRISYIAAAINAADGSADFIRRQAAIRAFAHIIMYNDR